MPTQNTPDEANTPTPDADEAVDPQQGSQLEENSQGDVIETEDAG